MLAWFSPDGTNISSRIENLRGKGCLRTNSNKAARVELTERGADMLDPDKHSFTSKYRNLMPQLKATVHKTTKVETFGVIEITKDDLVQMVRAAGVDMPMDVWIDAEFPLKIQWSSTEIKEDE